MIRENQIQRSRKRGFTLIELMIVVAIIGLLAAVALPSFRNYQFSSKRAEAYTNLSGLVKSQKAYHAEHGAYIGVPIAEPGFTQGSVPSGTKRDVTELSNAFASVGWSPDGNVFYDYDAATTGSINGADHPACTCANCITMAAYGDIDDDGSEAVIVYVQPDDSGNSCTTGLFGFGVPVSSSGDPQFNEIVRIPVGVADNY